MGFSHRVFLHVPVDITDSSKMFVRACVAGWMKIGVMFLRPISAAFLVRAFLFAYEWRMAFLNKVWQMLEFLLHGFLSVFRIQTNIFKEVGCLTRNCHLGIGLLIRWDYQANINQKWGLSVDKYISSLENPYNNTLHDWDPSVTLSAGDIKTKIKPELPLKNHIF